ncbi:hypothetical protein B0H14DRAFT_2914627 [Mycena olivaceomarginata]|nr:hypothetical protein B0H14DRAFT_2914627 [Mycena olivaceomarginata]
MNIRRKSSAVPSAQLLAVPLRISLMGFTWLYLASAMEHQGKASIMHYIVTLKHVRLRVVNEKVDFPLPNSTQYYRPLAVGVKNF